MIISFKLCYNILFSSSFVAAGIMFSMAFRDETIEKMHFSFPTTEYQSPANRRLGEEIATFNSHQGLNNESQPLPNNNNEATTQIISNNADADENDRLSSSIGVDLFDVTKLEHAPAPPAHTGPKTVLVTGAAGFVGSHVSEFLLARGDRVIVLDEVNDYYNTSIKESNLKLLEEKSNLYSGNVVIYRGDICNLTLLQNIFETEQPTWVVHMAARAGVRPSILDPFVYIHSNIQGTTSLLEMAIKYNVVNFVMASSSSVYGGSKSTLFDEQENVDFPISPYAASKRVTELMGTYYHSTFGLPITALRFFTVYGPRGRPDMAPFKFIDWTARGRPIQQFGNGSSSRDYTYIDDIVSGVVGALDRPTPIYQNVNLGKGSGTSLSQFVKLVAKYVGKQPEIKILPDQPGDVPYTCANVTRAHTMLNYTPTIPFETGIAKTVEWYKEVYPYQITPDISKNQLPKSKIREMEIKKNATSTQQRKNKSRRRLQAVNVHEDKKKVLVIAQQESTLLTRQVVNGLVDRGDSVVVVVPTASMHKSVEVEAFQFDQKEKVVMYTGCVDNATFLEEVFVREKPKWVTYLNTLSNATASKADPYTFINVNIQAFVRILEVMHYHDIANFVFTSSTKVYEPMAVWHGEGETISKFESPYAVTQKSRELFAHTWHSLYRTPMTALRLPQIYGPANDWFLSEANAANDGLTDEEEMNAVQEFMFVDDAADGILRALDRPYPYQILNLGQGPEMVEEACQSRGAIKEMLQAHLGGNFFSTSNVGPCPLVMVKKAQRRLGFSSQVHLREGIRRMAAWLRNHPDILAQSSFFSHTTIDLLQQNEYDDKSQEYPPLPWDDGTNPDRLTNNFQVIRNFDRIPIGYEQLVQLQWVVAALFIVGKFATWRSRRNS